jgi:3-isopropylmalate dehydrogenase
VNPVGQILALAMMLRESFGLTQQADRVERAIRAVWRDGWRTADIAEAGCRTIGTREIAERIAEHAAASSPMA